MNDTNALIVAPADAIRGAAGSGDAGRRCIDYGQDTAASARLAAIVQNSNDAIIGRTLAGTITSWNAGTERMLGYTAAETIGQSITFTLSPGGASRDGCGGGMTRLVMVSRQTHCSAGATVPPMANEENFA